MTSSLVDISAELGSEEEDEDYNEETGEVRGRQSRTNGTNGAIDDSSEEEEDDDDEEAARAVSPFPSLCLLHLR